MWLPYYLEHNKDSQNIAALFVNGRAELGLFITQERIGLPENLWNQETWMWNINHYWKRENFVAFKSRLEWKFCEGHEPRRSCLSYLREKFPKVSEANLKECIFIGPQIPDLIKEKYFDMLFQVEEKAAWDRFKFVVKGCLKNRRAQNYKELVNNLLQSCQNLDCNMSLKIHFLH